MPGARQWMWFIAIWAASIAALGAVSFILRLWIA